MKCFRYIAATLLLCLHAGLAAAAGHAQPAEGLKIDVTIRDQSHLSVPAVQLQLRLGADVVATAATGETGHGIFASLKPGRYGIPGTKEGFEPLNQPDVLLAEGGSL